MANGLEGVDRALRVLTLLGQRGDGWTLDELANETGLPKSSLHRLLTTMKARGFAVQPAASGPYLLGPAALEVAGVPFARLADVQHLVGSHGARAQGLAEVLDLRRRV